MYSGGYWLATQHNMSRTMRIDLIPDVPKEASDGASQLRVVVSSGASRPDQTNLPAPDADAAGDSRYHELLHSIYDAALITDMQGVIAEVNARAVEFLQCACG